MAAQQTQRTIGRASLGGAMTVRLGCLRRFSAVRAGGDRAGHSKRFLRRAETDPYGKAKSRARGEPSYVARSAHKLIQLDQQLGIFPRSARPTSFRVLDLGAAPGGWSQVVLERLALVRCRSAPPTAPASSAAPPPTEPRSSQRAPAADARHRLVACDLLPLHPSIGAKVAPNVDFHSVQGDFMDSQVRAKIVGLLFGPAAGRGQDSDADDGHDERAGETARNGGGGVTTIILSDMLHSMTGVGTRDSQHSLDLSLGVAALARDLVAPRPPGAHSPDTLILKHLQSEFSHQLRERLRADWTLVKWLKPLASRAESREGYFVTRGRRT